MPLACWVFHTRHPGYLFPACHKGRQVARTPNSAASGRLTCYSSAGGSVSLFASSLSLSLFLFRSFCFYSCCFQSPKSVAYLQLPWFSIAVVCDVELKKFTLSRRRMATTNPKSHDDTRLHQLFSREPSPRRWHHKRSVAAELG